MSKKVNNEAKALKQAAKALVARADAKTQTKAKAKRARRKRAGQQLILEHKGGDSLQRPLGKFFSRVFSKQDAARLNWMLTVADPFGGYSATIPPSLTPGIPLSVPRIYKYKFTGNAVANSAGCLYIGANADMWLPNPSKSAITTPEPQFCFVGNSVANGGSRGYPVHYTVASYAGTSVAGSTGNSYPGSAITVAAGTAGLRFLRFPDNLIATQLNNDPASANATQRMVCVSLGLRARPVAPATGALVPQGVLLMVQQILGDVYTTNPVAASGTAPVGGVDCYAYIKGLGSVAGDVSINRPSGLSPEMVGLKEWDVMEWPHSGGRANWLTAAAVPVQSCCYGAWVPKQTGDSVVGAPQLAVLGAGMASGQVVEFEAEYTYAFYGATSYEVNAFKPSAPVPAADVMATSAAAASHMNISSSKLAPEKQALLSVAQPHVSSGDFSASDAAAWVKTGANVIEEFTGSSIAELVGEGLGFLAALF